MPFHPKTIDYSGFKGINNVLKPEQTDPSYLKEILNIDIDKSGALSKREGYTQKIAGNFTALWASENGLGCYGVLNGNLVKIEEDNSYSILLYSIGESLVSFEEVDGYIYFSSITHNGIIVNGQYIPWGIPKNLIQPTLTAGTGNLVGGTYQVCFTYVNSLGIESGTVNSSYITVTSGSSISLYIPTHSDASVIYARVYCSNQDGSTNYYIGMGLLGTTFTISTLSSSSNPLRTQGLDKAPLGHIVRYYRGRLYIADGNILWYSEPFQYQHFDLTSNYFEFPEEILEVLPVEDGIWVGADKLYYLSGDQPNEFKRTTKEHIKIIKGTSEKVSGSYIHMDNTPIGYKWFVTADLGIFILFNQGLVINLTSQNIEIGSATSGAATFIRTNGTNQYLSILKTNENPNNSVMGDLVESTIVRNGIIIP